MLRHACALVLLALPGVAAAAPAAPHIVTADDFRRTMLDAQNAARAEVGSPALRWSETLADAAAAHAAELARTGRFQHAALSEQGENLWMGTRNAFSYRQMVDRWLAERQSRGLGHYTQIVWRTTDQVGCAVARGPGADYLVCRYLPGGNVVGERPF